MSVDIKRLNIGDKVLVEAVVADIDKDDEDRPLLLRIGEEHDTVWIDGAYVRAQIFSSVSGEQQ